MCLLVALELFCIYNIGSDTGWKVEGGKGELNMHKKIFLKKLYCFAKLCRGWSLSSEGLYTELICFDFLPSELLFT